MLQYLWCQNWVVAFWLVTVNVEDITGAGLITSVETPLISSSAIINRKEFLIPSTEEVEEVVGILFEMYTMKN